MYAHCDHLNNNRQETWMRKVLAISLGLVMLSVSVSAWEDNILSMKQRSELIDNITVERFNSVLPPIMEREGIDMWV